ncbi:hypothetical protein Wenmar_01405 [Wenxinia marina DSM 24838]|uniref:Dehydrogenase n=1 Tax=Wenxinia marina DSM 24838 TaxID=1123501 RepID=A0A0D0NNK3_9RHOB|nr:hypothetical protein Wenmar_01405 [Wenxinia marina DSM 24838]
MPDRLRKAGLGTPGDVAPLFVFLASAAAAGITGQCIGIGGDRLAIWSHPDEATMRLQPGGWSEAQIRARWEEFARDHIQSVGLELPL